MDKNIRKILDDLQSTDVDVQYAAYVAIMKITDEPVGWAYDVWDECLRNLRHTNNHIRSQASQLLCNLAKSDPERRIMKDFAAVMAVTRDEKFVTARHTLQSIWKVGAVGPAHQRMVMDRMEARYKECSTEKNSTLIRFDIIEGMRRLYDAVHDEEIKAAALALIEIEVDLKYRKKYATLWKLTPRRGAPGSAAPSVETQ